jgi:hypothetical protein
MVREIRTFFPSWRLMVTVWKSWPLTAVLRSVLSGNSCSISSKISLSLVVTTNRLVFDDDRVWHMLTPVAVLEGNQYAYRDTVALDMLPEGWEPMW